MIPCSNKAVRNLSTAYDAKYKRFDNPKTGLTKSCGFGYKKFDKDEEYKTARIGINNACITGVCANHFTQATSSLVAPICGISLKDELFRYSVEKPYKRYLLFKSGIINLGGAEQPVHDRILPQHNLHAYKNIMGWNTADIEQSDNKMDRDSVTMTLTSTESLPILNWLSLISMYVMHKGLVLENFQKIMIAHAVMFEGSSRASNKMFLLEPLILEFLDIDTDDNMARDYRSQQCINIIPRRMGKSFIAEILMASVSIASKTKIGYGANSLMLCKEVKKQIIEMIAELYGLVEKLPEEFRNRFPQLFIPKTLLRMDKEGAHRSAVSGAKDEQILTLKFADGSNNSIQFMTLTNKNVSIYIYFINFPNNYSKYIHNNHPISDRLWIASMA
jgi:hypothetical protein